MKQGSQEWLDMRKNFIGASDAPVILKVSPWKTPYQLWEEKLGISFVSQDNDATRYGKKMEEPARRAYEKYTGSLVSTDSNDTVVFHKEKKYMMASLDGICLDSGIPIEIKNVNSDDHLLAKKGKIPSKYYPQVQHQLAVLNINLLHYFSYRDGDGVIVEVERDEDYIKKLYSEEGDFWAKVQNLEEPELTERDYQLFDSKDWIQIANEWGLISDQLKELEEKEKQYRKLLIDMAGNRNAMGGGVKLTKNTKKGTIDYKSIPELEKVDLEKYRKGPVMSWRISKCIGCN